MEKFDSFEKAIEYYSPKALEYDLKKNQIRVYEELQKRIDLIEIAKSESEIIEIKNKLRNDVIDIEKRLRLSYRSNGSMEINWVAGYLEYSKLYNDAEAKLNQLDNPKNNMGKSKPQKEFISYENLFHNHNLADECISALKEVAPKLLSESNEYIGKNKGGNFSMFLDGLKKMGLIKSHYSDDVYTKSFNNKFINLNLDGSEFRKIYNRITEADKLDLNLKLSQISQRGKNGK